MWSVPITTFFFVFNSYLYFFKHIENRKQITNYFLLSPEANLFHIKAYLPTPQIIASPPLGSRLFLIEPMFIYSYVYF